MLTPSPFSQRIGSERIAGACKSVTREMTREAHKHDAISLSQGIPDENETPVSVKKATKATTDTSSQCTITWGLPGLHETVSERYADWKGIRYDPETEVTVTTGISEVVVSTFLALCGPDNDVIYSESAYKGYIPAVQFTEGGPIPPDITGGLELDADTLWDAAQEASMLIPSHPHNPAGNVLSPAELELAAEVAAEEGLMAVTDGVYEHIVYTDDYVSPVEVDGLAGWTVVCAGLSKTYSVTDWRIGSALAPEPPLAELRKAHDHTNIYVPTPFQRAGVETLSLPADCYDDLSDAYERRDKLLYDGLREVDLNPVKPSGAYCMLTRYPGDAGDTEFAHRLAREAGVAVVPGSSFYTEGSTDWVRFTFSRNEATIEEALRRLGENRF